MDTLNAIHAKMRREVVLAGGVIDAIFVCPHGPDDGCACRKPTPGLFHHIASRYDIKLQNVPAVAESFRDLHATSHTACATRSARRRIRTRSVGSGILMGA